MNHFFKERSFKNSMRLFSVLFCLPIILIAIVIKIYFNGPIQSNYISQHNDSVMQEVAYLDQQLGQIEVLVSSQGQSFTTDFDLRPLQGLSSYEEIGNLSQDLFFLKNSNSLIKNAEILVFNGDESFLIGDGGTYPMSNLKSYRQYIINNGKNYQWLTDNQEQVVFVQNISSIVAQGSAYLATTLNKEKVLSLLKVSATEDGSVALGVDGKLVVSSGALFSHETLPQLTEDTLAWQEKVNRVKYSLVAARMTRLSQEWIFYSASPISLIIEPLNHFSNILFLIGFLLFLISLILGQIFARRTYQPVDNLMARILDDKTENPQGNEFDYLIQRWQTIVREKSELELKSHSAASKLKQAVLSHMLEGKYSYLNEKDLQQLLQKNGWNKPVSQYQILFIRVTGQLTAQAEETVNTSEVFILGNLIHDLAQRFFPDFSEVEYREDGLVLFVANPESTALQEFTQNVFTFVNKIIHKYVVITIGRPENELGRLSFRVNEVERLCNYQKIVAENQVIAAEAPQRLREYSYPEHIAQKIVGEFQRGEVAAVEKDLQAFSDFVLPSGAELEVAVKTFGKLYDQISYVLTNKHVSETSYMAKKLLLRKIRRQVTPQQITAVFMESYLAPGMELIKESQQTSTEGAVEKAIAYLKEDYQNPSLSLEETADYVGLEASYLSREFKRITKVNFIDYLTDFRLEQAKNLLAQSNLKINDIAEAVGYNPSYFNRLFKKKFAITPGQYRKKFNESQQQ